jgi:hypothetical protein
MIAPAIYSTNRWLRQRAASRLNQRNGAAQLAASSAAAIELWLLLFRCPYRRSIIYTVSVVAPTPTVLWATLTSRQPFATRAFTCSNSA